MKFYNITSDAGQTMGVFEGETEVEALAAMHRDAGYDVTVEDGELVFTSDDAAELCGDVDDYTIEEVSMKIDVTICDDGWGDWGSADLDDVAKAYADYVEQQIAKHYPDAEISVEVSSRSSAHVTVGDRELDDESRSVEDIMSRAWDSFCGSGYRSYPACCVGE